jgi:hypothetical protein
MVIILGKDKAKGGVGLIIYQSTAIIRKGKASYRVSFSGSDLRSVVMTTDECKKNKPGVLARLNLSEKGQAINRSFRLEAKG